MNVYLLYAGGRFKVGISRDINKRVSELQCGCPYPISLIAKIYYDPSGIQSARKIEHSIHLEYYTLRVVGEWFAFDRSTVEQLIDKYRFTKVSSIPTQDNTKPQKARQQKKKQRTSATKSIEPVSVWHKQSIEIKERCESLYSQLEANGALRNSERLSNLRTLLGEAQRLPTCFWWQSRKHMNFILGLWSSLVV